MTRKILLYIVILLLLVLAGGLITGGFDVHPLAALPVALVIPVLAAYVIRKGRGRPQG